MWNSGSIFLKLQNWSNLKLENKTAVIKHQNSTTLFKFWNLNINTRESRLFVTIILLLLRSCYSYAEETFKRSFPLTLQRSSSSLRYVKTQRGSDPHFRTYETFFTKSIQRMRLRKYIQKSIVFSKALMLLEKLFDGVLAYLKIVLHFYQEIPIHHQCFL